MISIHSRVCSLAIACAVIAGTLIMSGEADAKKRDFKNQDLSGQIFNDANLDGSDFSGAVLKNVQMKRALLRDTLWADADLRTARLDFADLTNADLRHAVMPFVGEGVNFSNANFEGLNLADYYAYNCNFRGANLRDTEGWNMIVGSSFREADLRGADLHGMQMAPDVTIFTGAIYDDETIWPAWVDMSKLRAKKVE